MPLHFIYAPAAPHSLRFRQLYGDNRRRQTFIGKTHDALFASFLPGLCLGCRPEAVAIVTCCGRWHMGEPPAGVPEFRQLLAPFAESGRVFGSACGMNALLRFTPSAAFADMTPAQRQSGRCCCSRDVLITTARRLARRTCAISMLSKLTKRYSGATDRSQDKASMRQPVGSNAIDRCCPRRISALRRQTAGVTRGRLNDRLFDRWQRPCRISSCTRTAARRQTR